MNPPIVPQYNMYKADWERYEFHIRNIPPLEHIQDHNETNRFLVDFIKNADDKAIPKSKSHPTKQSPMVV